MPLAIPIRTLGLIMLLLVLSAAVVSAGDSVPLSARECKMLLKPGGFTDRTQGMREFWGLVKEVAIEQGVKVKDLDGAFNLESARIIRFFDTPTLQLFKKGLILRQRQEAEIRRGAQVKKEGKKFELVLKFRHPDPVVAAVQDCQPAGGFNSEVSLEEDVAVKADSIDHLFSLSGKIRDVKKIGDRLDDWGEFYPGLRKTGLDGFLEIKQVNGITVTEFLVEPGKLEFPSGVKAKVSLAVWYRNGQTTPLIAEFSYKYRLEAGDRLNSRFYRSARESDAFLTALQTKARSRIAVGQTKTGLIYKASASHQE